MTHARTQTLTHIHKHTHKARGKQDGTKTNQQYNKCLHCYVYNTLWHEFRHGGWEELQRRAEGDDTLGSVQLCLSSSQRY